MFGNTQGVHLKRSSFSIGTPLEKNIIHIFGVSSPYRINVYREYKEKL